MSYRVFAEHYYNDRCRTDHVLFFDDLDNDFRKWLDEHYNGSSLLVPWYQTRNGEDICRLDLGTQSDGGCWWIHEIDSNLGIEFTDGRRTNGKKHASKRIRCLLEEIWTEKQRPELRFVD